MTIENVQRVERLVKEQRNVTLREIMEEVGIGTAAAETILNEHLNIRKLQSRWVPHLLTPEQKQTQVDWVQFIPKKFDEGRSKLVSQIVTGDETWIYNYDPETKQQSRVWIFEDEPSSDEGGSIAECREADGGSFLSTTGSGEVVPLVEQKTVTANCYVEVCLPAVLQELSNNHPNTGLRGPHVASGQCQRPHCCPNNGLLARVRDAADSPSAVFARSGTMLLLSVPQGQAGDEGAKI